MFQRICAGLFGRCSVRVEFDKIGAVEIDFEPVFWPGFAKVEDVLSFVDNPELRAVGQEFRL